MNFIIESDYILHLTQYQPKRFITYIFGYNHIIKLILSLNTSILNRQFHSYYHLKIYASGQQHTNQTHFSVIYIFHI